MRKDDPRPRRADRWRGPLRRAAERPLLGLAAALWVLALAVGGTRALGTMALVLPSALAVGAALALRIGPGGATATPSPGSAGARG